MPRLVPKRKQTKLGLAPNAEHSGETGDGKGKGREGTPRRGLAAPGNAAHAQRNILLVCMPARISFT